MSYHERMYDNCFLQEVSCDSDSDSDSDCDCGNGCYGGNTTVFVPYTVRDKMLDEMAFAARILCSLGRASDHAR